MKRWRFAPRARADLDEIWRYVARQGSIATANRLLDKIYSGVTTLARMPKAGRDRSDLALGLRSFPVDNYLIYYRARARGGVLISRVLHGKRDQRAAFLN